MRERIDDSSSRIENRLENVVIIYRGDNLYLGERTFRGYYCG
jgi:hypothetical protein